MVLSTHIDYYSGTCYLNTLKEAEEFFDDLARMVNPRDELTIERKPRKLGEDYTWRIDSVWGIYGAMRTTQDRVKIGLQLPGEFCRKLENQNEAVQFFQEYTIPTRIDLALDDQKRRISQSKLNAIAKLGHYKGVDSYKFIESKACQDGEEGGTCQFGQTDKVIRYYNAEIVHNLPADRWELQSRGDYACQITSKLAQESIEAVAGGIVTGAIDFVSRGETWRHETRYDFWTELREETGGPITIKPTSQEQSLDKMMNWLKRQVSPSLSVLYFGLGRTQYLSLMESLATYKNDQLTETQLSWIHYLQRAKEKPIV